jgi:hypothetical protein
MKISSTKTWDLPTAVIIYHLLLHLLLQPNPVDLLSYPQPLLYVQELIQPTEKRRVGLMMNGVNGKIPWMGQASDRLMSF